MPKPRYSEELLLRLIDETKDLEDLIEFGLLLSQLEEQGDITITRKMVNLSNIKVQQFNYER